MRRLRTTSTRRLYGLVAVVALLAATAGIAQAALGGSASAPDPKPLDRAVLDALRAPQVDGVSARITFTNGLLPGGSLPERGGSPLAQGAGGPRCGWPATAASGSSCSPTAATPRSSTTAAA